MPSLDPAAVERFGKCLSGTADYKSCPDPGCQNAEAWLDGLMQAQKNFGLLMGKPCSMSEEDAKKVKPTLDALAEYTYTSGSKTLRVWDYVVDLFAVRSAARKTAARDLAMTAAQLARDNPNLSTQDIAARAELEQMLKALNGGY